METTQYLRSHHSIEIQEEPRLTPWPKVSISEPRRIIEVRQAAIQKDFRGVLERRRSARQLQSVDAQSALSVLYDSARVKDGDTTENGFHRTSRPYPSAGGRHPLELFCVCNDVSGLERGTWYFDPFRLKLILTALPDKFAEGINQRACALLGESQPPMVIVAVGVVNRTLSRYENGLSLVWRDTGNLFGIMSLVCVAHEMQSCQLGISEEFSFQESIGLGGEPLWITGGMAVGK